MINKLGINKLVSTCPYFSEGSPLAFLVSAGPLVSFGLNRSPFLFLFLASGYGKQQREAILFLCPSQRSWEHLAGHQHWNRMQDICSPCVIQEPDHFWVYVSGTGDTHTIVGHVGFLLSPNHCASIAGDPNSESSPVLTTCLRVSYWHCAGMSRLGK